MKICKKCLKEYDEANFRKGRALCIKCDNERARSYRNNNIENSRKLALETYHRNKTKESNIARVLNYRKKWYQENKEYAKLKSKEWASAPENKEKIKNRLKEYRKEYEKVNADKILERKRNHRRLNIEDYRKRKRDWTAKNPEACRLIKQRRRAIEHSLVNDFTANDWELAKSVFNNKCAYCGSDAKLTQEHFVPVIKGGGYTANNIIPVCKSCNSSKSKSSFDEWYHKQEFYLAIRERKIYSYLSRMYNLLEVA